MCKYRYNNELLTLCAARYIHTGRLNIIYWQNAPWEAHSQFESLPYYYLKEKFSDIFKQYTRPCCKR